MIIVHGEDGMWCAATTVAPGVPAFGDGTTADEAQAALDYAVSLLRAETEQL